MSHNIKLGDRYTNHLGELCIVKFIFKDTINLQVLGDKSRTEGWFLEDFIKQDNILKIPSPKIDRTNIAKYLLEYQLNMTGKTYFEAKRTENWLNTWTISEEEYFFFRVYAIALIKKIFRINTKKAKGILKWFNMQFGLKRVKNE